MLERGHDVHVLDNLSSGWRGSVPDEVPLHVLDVRATAARELFAEEEYDVLIHHAAQMDVRASVEDPGLDADINICGFLNLMEAGRKNGLQKVIFASTGGAIYGEPEYTPQDVEHPCRPVSPYGVAKLSIEKYLRYYLAEHGIESVALRYANVYGPRQNAEGEAGVVAIFAREMLTDGQPVIYGDGQQTRDYVYVGDVVRANLAALDYDGSGVFNVGTGQETSVNELFRLMRQETGADVAEHHEEARPGEQQRSVLGYGETAKTLGWEPEVCIEEGLSRTVEWFRERYATEEAP